MTERSERPRQQARYEEKRAGVVTAASRVFAVRGYDQTSVPDLADALGMAVGSLYHYFEGKEQLLIAICDQLMEPLLERALAIDGEGVERLHALVVMWIAHVAEHRDHMLVFQQERHLIERGEQWRGVRASRKAFERLVDDVLAEVEAAGVLARVDRRLALVALLGMVNHTPQWFRPRGPLPVNEIAGGYVRLLLAGPHETELRP